jgi:hypothetical protein
MLFYVKNVWQMRGFTKGKLMEVVVRLLFSYKAVSIITGHTPDGWCGAKTWSDLLKYALPELLF